MAYNILLMGASYGSLLASKMLFGGHKIHLVCLPAEAELINKEGFRVRMPTRGRKDPVVLDSRELPGQVTAGGAEGVNPADYDLVGLCMQEPQYRVPAVKDLLDKVAKSRVPCMSIMNMPPLAYMRRIPGLDHEALVAQLRHRGHLGQLRRALSRTHGQCTQLARSHQRQDSGNGGDEGLGVTRHQALHRRRIAVVGNMRELRAGEQHEELHGAMAGAARPGRAVEIGRAHV